MDFSITIMLIGFICFAIGLLNLRHGIKQMEKNPNYNTKEEGFFGKLCTFLLFFGAFLIIIGLMSGNVTGLGDPSEAPNWRGR